MRRIEIFGGALAALAVVWTGCTGGPIGDERDQSPLYRSGTEEDGFTSNGERGNVLITEVNWAGSVTDDGVYDPTDVYIELQNKHPRPLHLTGWQLIVEAGTNRPGDNPRSRITYPIPLRENGEPFETNEYVVITTRADGASVKADYIIPDLKIPRDFFRITIRDIDDRLIEPAGSTHLEVFAGGFDLVTVRSMERVQLLFSNRGTHNASWHAYSYNEWDEDHAVRQEFIREGFKLRTFGSPGKANSPDYSGNTSSGSFE